jgi:hypothetical protein
MRRLSGVVLLSCISATIMLVGPVPASSSGLTFAVSAAFGQGSSGRDRTAPASFPWVVSDVSADSATDAWAVGYEDGPDTATRANRILHWNGIEWSRIDSPNPSSTWSPLYGVDARSPTDVWAVGEYQDDETGSFKTLILRWDGAEWSQVKSPNPSLKSNGLQDVDASSASNAWAVGYYKDDETRNQYPTLIVHWDGTRWSKVHSPSPDPHDEQLLEVAARSATDAWAVGHYNQQPLIVHWNGTSWSKIKSPNPGAPYTGILEGVDAESATDAWAVGYYYNQTVDALDTLIVRWNGRTWSQVKTPLTGRALLGVSGTRPRDVWSVGSRGVNYPKPLIFHWDGQRWSKVDSPNPSSIYSELFTVSASSGNAAWAMGGYADDATEVNSALILHWNGRHWAQA